MPFLERALHDLRFACRTLARTPAVTTIALLSLALGIGANTAIFSLIDTVLLKLLPVRDPQRLVLLSNPNANGVSVGTQGGERNLFSYGEFEHIRDKQQVFDGMFVAQSEAQRVRAGIDGGIIPIALDAEHKTVGLEIHAERAADHAAVIVG